MPMIMFESSNEKKSDLHQQDSEKSLNDIIGAAVTRIQDNYLANMRFSLKNLFPGHGDNVSSSSSKSFDPFTSVMFEDDVSMDEGYFDERMMEPFPMTPHTSTGRMFTDAQMMVSPSPSDSALTSTTTSPNQSPHVGGKLQLSLANVFFPLSSKKLAAASPCESAFTTTPTSEDKQFVLDVVPSSMTFVELSDHSNVSTCNNDIVERNDSMTQSSVTSSKSIFSRWFIHNDDDDDDNDNNDIHAEPFFVVDQRTNGSVIGESIPESILLSSMADL